MKARRFEFGTGFPARAGPIHGKPEAAQAVPFGCSFFHFHTGG